MVPRQVTTKLAKATPMIPLVRQRVLDFFFLLCAEGVGAEVVGAKDGSAEVGSPSSRRRARFSPGAATSDALA